MLSHIVTIKTEVRDHAAVSAACRRLELPPPVLGTAQLFEGSDTAVSAPDPLAAIKAIGSLATPDGTALLVLRNFHRFLGSVEVVQTLDTAIAAGKQNRTILVILSPVLQIPSELDRQFVVIETICLLGSRSSRSPAPSPPSPANCPTTKVLVPQLVSPGSRRRMHSRSR